MAPGRYRALVAAMCVLTGLGIGICAGLFIAFAGVIATPSADAAVDSYSSGTLERNIVIAFTVCTALGLCAGVALAVLVDRFRQRSASRRPPAGPPSAPWVAPTRRGPSARP